MRVAIIKLSSLGDIIHAAIVLQFIKTQLPAVQIDWFVDESFREILAHEPHIENIITLPLRRAKKDKKLFFTIFKKLRGCRNNYDLIIDMQGLIKSAIVARILGKNIVGFDKYSIREKLASRFYRKGVSISYAANSVERYAELASQALNITITESDLLNKKPFMCYEQIDLDFTKTYFLKDKKNIIFVIGASWVSKIYPKEKFAELANHLDENILIIYGNEQEREDADYIAANSSCSQVLPKMNFNQLKAAISQADLLVGNDTGPSYISWANNIPTIVLFGPTPTTKLLASAIHKSIKTRSKVDPYKLDHNDFSLRELEPRAIVVLIKTLFSQISTL